MQYDLIVRHAQLHRRQGPVDIAVKDGSFSKIASELSSDSAAREVDVAGRLVSPPFIDAHVHLDAVLTVGQPRYNTTGTLLEGIQIWSERKPSLTVEDVKQRKIEHLEAKLQRKNEVLGELMEEYTQLKKDLGEP